MAVATWLVWILTAYAAVGLIAGCVFIAFGIAKIDPLAQGAGWGFRLVVLPGTIALWPLLLSRWLRGVTHPPLEHHAHRDQSS